MTVTGDAPLTFFYKVSSESGYDFLHFYLDGVEQDAWSGEVPWTQYSLNVSAGDHTFTWSYIKDLSVNGGQDAGFIDFVEFPPFAEPGVPVIGLSAESFDASLASGGTADQTLTISNVGTGNLEFGLALVEVDGRSAAVPSIEPMDLAKGERDPREGNSPLTGFGGPDTFGYSWVDSDEVGGPVYGWIDISGSGSSIPSPSDDGNYGPFDLGFSFSFYGQIFDSVYICTNGFLSFTSTSTAYNNAGIPNGGEPNNLLAPFWDDMSPNTAGSIYYEAVGGQFIVQFQDVEHYLGGNPETFQVILDSDGSITYQYATVASGTGCTVGIENGAGDDGLEIVANAAYLHDGLAIRIATAPPLTWATTDVDAGIIPAGGMQDINLHFDATGLANGTYAAVLAVGSNDQANSYVELPVTLNVTDGVSAVEGLPNVLQLHGAVPNPFNPMTDIKFTLPHDARVSLKIYDISGRLVQELANETMSAGEHSVRWMGRDNAGKAVASGTYFMRLVADGETSVKSMVLVR